MWLNLINPWLNVSEQHKIGRLPGLEALTCKGRVGKVCYSPAAFHSNMTEHFTIQEESEKLTINILYYSLRKQQSALKL